MSNILRHPAADGAPVRNPARRGRRPSNVTPIASATAARQRPTTPPTAPGYAPAMVNIIVEHGHAEVKSFAMADASDSFEMLMWLYIFAGHALRQLGAYLDERGAR